MMRDARFAWGLARRRPFSVLVQVTNRCNMTCPFCAFWSNPAKPREELKVEDYARISAELATVGTFLVSVEGGEPTLRPDLVQIVEAFAAHHLVVLYTNGWRMTPELARDLFAAGLHQVGVSIDFADEAHDAKRGLDGARERAWKAVEVLRDAAPKAERQVHVMTVLMGENAGHWDTLLDQSAEAGVGHAFTLLATQGDRRTDADPLPLKGAVDALAARVEPMMRVVIPSDYLPRSSDYLAGRPLPRCHAGLQSFNLDHLGNVAPCIEKIGQTVGSVRAHSMPVLLDRLQKADAGKGCQACFTLCRGIAQSWGGGGSVSAWRDLMTRMRV